jgi:subtilisin family serine protease
VTITDTTTTPTGLIALASTGRRPLANSPDLYFSFQTSATVMISSQLSLSVTLPSAPSSGQQYFVATWNGSAWNLGAFGPGTVSGNTLTFSSNSSGSLTFQPGIFWFGLYHTASAATPAFTPSPPVSPNSTVPPRTSASGEILSQVSLQSNPSGLQVLVNTCALGTTPLTNTPPQVSTVTQYDIVPTNGAAHFIYKTDQTANGNRTVYYNQAADTNGSIGSVSATSVGRAPSSARADSSGPRFGPFRSTGLAQFSSTRFAVHYRTSALNMSGRHAADIESFEGVKRAVGIGFERNGEITRLVDLPAGRSMDSMVGRMRAHAEVNSAEPLALRYKTSASPFTPNDSHFNNLTQWDMFRMDFLDAWGYTHGVPEVNSGGINCTPSGSGIAIAILDTGLDSTHPDLGGGKVVCGEKVVNGQIFNGVSAAQDTDGHGTNVSGIAAADTNNSAGFAGGGFNVSLQIYKIFPDGASPSANTGDEAQAIYDAVAHGARVISMSLGGAQGGNYDPVERDAVEFAIANHVVVVAASGNDAAGTIDLPAGYDGVISVGATSLNDAANPGVYSAAVPEFVASYSNFGPRLTVVAPGGDPPSCESGGTCAIDNLHWIENLYTRTPLDPTQQCGTSGTTGVAGSDPTRSDCKALFAGTSQATPHVSAVVALMLSVNPALTPAQVSQILQSTADDIGDAKQGHGRVNAYRALAAVERDAVGLPLPGNMDFVAIAYTNSGGTTPAIADVTFPKGVPVASNGTFRIADVLSSTGTYHCAVWADVNGDGIVDAGDWFGVATGTGSGSAPCSGATNIVAHPVAGGFTLP